LKSKISLNVLLSQDITVNDNDSLAALLSAEIRADLMVLMSDVEGVFTGPPGLDGSRLMHTYCPSLNTASVRYGAMSRVGSGGMQSKVMAYRLIDS
jgi:delta-1-pyrroline-5-carboxylate synthetase